MSWKYPELLSFINKRSIKALFPIYVSENSLGKNNKYLDNLENNKLFIGYVIESTTGLLTDSTLCISRFSNELLGISAFKKMLDQYIGRICIIDVYSNSWGEKKVSLGNRIFKEWTDDFLLDNQVQKEICINNVHKLSIRLKINIV